MKQHIALVALLVDDYDDAIEFYVDKLGFHLVEDSAVDDSTTTGTGKRWVIISPPGATETRLLLARADGNEQGASVGRQSGGRVFLFLYTDDFWRDYHAYRHRGVEFVREEPREEVYGTVAVFRDLYGNLWDLIEPRNK